MSSPQGTIAMLRTVCGAALVSFLVACSPQLSVPADALVRCDGVTPCPTGFTCKASVGRCVPLASTDLTPPGLARWSLTPPSVNRSGRVWFSFTVDEALDRDPEISLGGQPFTRESAAGLDYVYGYPTHASDVEGTAPIDLRLVDRVGNVTEGPSGAAVTFDFTPPALSAASVTPRRAGPTTRVDIAFTATEPLSPSTRVVLLQGDGTAWQGEAAPAAAQTDGGYAYTPDGGEPEGEELRVVARVADLAQNPAELPLGTVRFDFTPPLPTQQEVSARLLHPGDVLMVRVRYAEELRTTPQVTMTSAGTTQTLLRRDVDTWTYDYEYSVRPGDGDTQWSLQLGEAVDLAGNRAPAQDLGVVHLDAVAPALANSATIAPGPLLKAGRELRVTFTVSEPLLALPTVKVGAQAMVPAPQPAATTYVYTHMVEAAEGEGLQQLSAVLIDLAGNVALADLGRVTYDFTSPEVSTATVSYRAAPTNPLGLVTRANADTTIVLEAFATEALDVSGAPPAPSLRLTCGAVSLVQAPTQVSATSATWAFKVPATTPDGPCTPVITWADLAGNVNAAATFAAPTVQVKTSAPRLRVDQSAVTYVRSPWGNAVAEDRGTWTLPAGPYHALAPGNPLAPEATLRPGTFVLAGSTPTSPDVAPTLVRLWTEPTSGLLLGTTAPLPPGGDWPRTQLPNSTAEALFATGVDEAGNESAAVKLRHVEWVATPNPDVHGASPHRLLGTQTVVNARDQDLTSILPNSAGGEGLDNQALVARSDPVWIALGSPLGRHPPQGTLGNGTIAFDSARGRVVLLINGETWEWDGTTWGDRTPTDTSTPGASAMTWDSGRSRVVVFDGADLWEWDGRAWTRLPASGARPSALGLLQTMTYDSAHRRLLLWQGHGAQSGPALVYDEFWSWDGAAWTQLTPAGARPLGSKVHALTYDARRGRAVLYQGDTSALWEWDGAAWTAPAVSTPKPSARGRFAMTADPVHGRVLLFGGFTGAGATVQDLWEWDGATWMKHEPTAAPPPSPRYWSGMTYDSARGRLVVFGGTEASAALAAADTWLWDGATWELRQAAPGRPDLNVCAHGGANALCAGDTTLGTRVAYDSVNHRTLLQDVTLNDLGSAIIHSTWSWNGAYWNQLEASTAWLSGPLVFDSTRGKSLLFSDWQVPVPSDGGVGGPSGPSGGSGRPQRPSPAAAPGHHVELLRRRLGAARPRHLPTQDLRRGDVARRRPGALDHLRRHEHAAGRLGLGRHHLGAAQPQRHVAPRRLVPDRGVRRAARRGRRLRRSRHQRRLAPQRDVDLGRQRVDEARPAQQPLAALAQRHGLRQRARAHRALRGPHGHHRLRRRQHRAHRLWPLRRALGVGRQHLGSTGRRRHDAPGPLWPLHVLRQHPRPHADGGRLPAGHRLRAVLQRALGIRRRALAPAGGAVRRHHPPRDLLPPGAHRPAGARPLRRRGRRRPAHHRSRAAGLGHRRPRTTGRRLVGVDRQHRDAALQRWRPGLARLARRRPGGSAGLRLRRRLAPVLPVSPPGHQQPGRRAGRAGLRGGARAPLSA